MFYLWVLLLKEKKLWEMKQGFQTIPHTAIIQRRANGYASFIRAVMKNESNYLFMVNTKVIVRAQQRSFIISCLLLLCTFKWAYLSAELSAGPDRRQ